MRKLLIILLVILLTYSLAIAAVRQWYDISNPTIAWDACTPVDGGTVEYEVFLVDPYIPDSTKVPTVLERIVENQVTIIIPDSDHYYIFGVRAVNIVEGVDTGTSEIAWTNIPEYVVDRITFGFKTSLLKRVTNIHVVGG